MSVESTRRVMTEYWDESLKNVAADAVYTTMFDGREARGRDAIGALLRNLYHEALEARFETRCTLIGDGTALLEGHIVGQHIGELAGVAATGRDVRVPVCVVYDVEGEQITRGRIYLQLDSFRAQVGAGQA